MKEHLTKSLNISMLLVMHPRECFSKITNENNAFLITVLFAISCMIPLVKSLFEPDKYKNNFFQNQNLNELISFFNIPQIRWLLALAGFFLFLFLANYFGKIFTKKYNKQSLLYCLLAISIVGILSHAIFYIGSFFLPPYVLIQVRMVIFTWVIFLSISGIKNSQDISYKAAICIFVISALPSIILIGLPGFSPYLLFL